MVEKVISVILLIITLLFVGINTAILDKRIARTVSELSTVDITSSGTEYAKERLEEIYAEFERQQIYASLTVNHDDLTNINECFIEAIGYLEVGDADGASVAKNRLIGSLEHLRRLSGCNIDAII